MTTTNPRRRNGTPRHIRNQRAHWSPIVNTGTVTCRRCQNPIQPGEPWDLGHPANRPYASGNQADDLAPEHRSCNRSGLITDQMTAFTGWPT